MLALPDILNNGTFLQKGVPRDWILDISSNMFPIPCVCVYVSIIYFIIKQIYNLVMLTTSTRPQLGFLHDGQLLYNCYATNVIHNVVYTNTAHK